MEERFHICRKTQLISSYWKSLLSLLTFHSRKLSFFSKSVGFVQTQSVQLKKVKKVGRRTDISIKQSFEVAKIFLIFLSLLEISFGWRILKRFARVTVEKKYITKLQFKHYVRFKFGTKTCHFPHLSRTILGTLIPRSA